MKSAPIIVRQISARPPITPPTIAPVLLLLDVGWKLGEETAVGEGNDADVDDIEDDVVVGDVETDAVEELDVKELEVEVVITLAGTGLAKS